MQFWWLIIIIGVASIPAYYPVSSALNPYPIMGGANKLVPYLPFIVGVMTALVEWFTQGSCQLKARFENQRYSNKIQAKTDRAIF